LEIPIAESPLAAAPIDELGGTLLTNHGPDTCSCPFTVTFPLNDALAAEMPPLPE
jgi:hypothetical protein